MCSRGRGVRGWMGEGPTGFKRERLAEGGSFLKSWMQRKNKFESHNDGEQRNKRSDAMDETCFVTNKIIETILSITERVTCLCLRKKERCIVKVRLHRHRAGARRLRSLSERRGDRFGVAFENKTVKHLPHNVFAILPTKHSSLFGKHLERGDE